MRAGSTPRTEWMRPDVAMSVRGEPRPFQSTRRPWCQNAIQRSSKSQRIGLRVCRYFMPS
jgi:hypothetical protein